MKSIYFFGTSAACPTKNRNVTAHALQFLNGKLWLLDCGEGTQHQFLKSPLKPSRIQVIMITHLHGDHSFGLPGLLASMSLLAGDKKENVKIYGPKGIKQLIETNLTLSATYITFPYEIHELEEGKNYPNIATIDDCDLSAYPIKHKVPCFGYVITEKDKPGSLDSKKAAQLGAKGAQLGVLKSGQDLTLADGTVIKSADVMGPSKKGKKVVLLGDTSDSSSIVDVGQDCDLLVHEATYDASKEAKAIEGGHSTSAMAGRYAKQLNAKKMILTHFSMRYTTSREVSDNKGKESEEKDLTVDDLVKEAQAECGNTVVTAAHDLEEQPF